jgi:hypothetical protein
VHIRLDHAGSGHFAASDWRTGASPQCARDLIGASCPKWTLQDLHHPRRKRQNPQDQVRKRASRRCGLQPHSFVFLPLAFSPFFSCPDSFCFFSFLNGAHGEGAPPFDPPRDQPDFRRRVWRLSRDSVYATFRSLYILRVVANHGSEGQLPK